MADYKTPQIKNLRSRITLSKAVQTAQAYPLTGIDITYNPITTVYADVAPTRQHLFIGVIQLDIDVNAPTHRAIIRWLDAPDIFDTVIRDTFRPDGTTRRETFRVLGVADLDNQRRFLKIDMQLQTSTSPFGVVETGNAVDACNATVS